MPRYVKRRVRYPSGRKVWSRVIRDFGHTYPTIDHWIEAVDRRDKWTKRRLRFTDSFGR